jgi:hypothetical protein
VSKHPVERVQKLSHHGDEGLQRLFASGEQLVIEGFDVGVAAYSDQGRHEEKAPQVVVATARHLSRLMDRGARVVASGIDARVSHPLARAHILGQDRELAEELDRALGGNAWGGDQQLEVLLQVRVAPDQLAGFAFQGFELGLQVLEMRLDVSFNGWGQGGDKAGRMQPIFLLRDQVRQIRETAADGS